ncbi:MAG TPA: ABC transporter ATP-binding protein [Candidatus Saccharimonadales bacterium]|nr:ABC transporter ATP-binding protein [Candidatus Saccharimonadales bacterium]
MKSIIRILVFAGSLWRYYAAIAVLTLFVAALTQLPPILIKVATDEISKIIAHQPAREQVVLWAVIGIFASGVVVTFLSNYSGYLGDIMAAKLRKILSERYFQHLLQLPQAYFDNELTGTIINRLNRSITDVTQFMNVFSNNFFSWLLQVVFAIAIVGYYSWQLAFLIFIIHPIFLFLTIRTSKKWIVHQGRKNEFTDVASGRFAEAVGQIRVVKSYNREAGERHFFEDYFKKFVQETYPQSRGWHWQDILRRMVLEVIFFGMLLYIFVQTYHGNFTVGTMFMMIQYILAVRLPIMSMSFIVDNTQRAVAGSQDFFKVMELEPQVADAPDAHAAIIKNGRIEFSHVDFGYDNEKRVLHDISFVVEPDTKVALVGESGEGKTTLTSLLLRLYDVDGGEILIDNQNIAEVTQHSLRHNIGVVFQDPNLFSGTIRENIAYGNPRASLKKIQAAAKAANAHDFIVKFTEGYDTTIGERGVKLSGGQKQRIAIARAILKDAPILILDEATSSLDSRSEHLVQEALERLMEGRTTLIIAHRLSTIADVDQIVTLRKGRIDEVGSPRQLAKSKGIYGQLLELQGASLDRQKRELKRFDIKAE